VILDTNALSAVAEGDVELEATLSIAREIAIPVIVLGEYRYGISHSRERQHYEKWLAEALLRFHVLDVDEKTTIHYVAARDELRQAGTPIPPNDYWIAALCRQHAMPLLSRDKHFDLVAGIQRVGW
jgi:tRNA(fMet)-specific endonuclease VapC